MSFDWGSLLSGAGALYGAYETSQAASNAPKAAAAAAQATQVHPYSGASTMGTTNFNNQTGQFSLNPTSNPFQAQFQNLGLASLSNAGTANSQPFNGASPDLVSAMNDANASSQVGSPQYQAVLDQMRAAAAPQNQRDQNTLANQQYANGTYGTSGGAQRLQALYGAQGQNDLNMQLAAGDTAASRAQARFANASQTVSQGMGNQQQQYNIGSGSFGGTQGIFGNLLNQGQLGVQAGGGQAASAAINAANQQGAGLVGNAQLGTALAGFGNSLYQNYGSPVQQVPVTLNSGYSFQK